MAYNVFSSVNLINNINSVHFKSVMTKNLYCKLLVVVDFIQDPVVEMRDTGIDSRVS